MAAARQLNKLKLRQAFDIYNLSLKRDQLADYFGIFILLTLIGSLALIIFMFHKLLYSPLIKLQMSMKQYLVDRKILVVDTGLVELRAISQTFAELADQLHQQRIAQVRYLAGIVHDLRNPISAISMAIEIADSRFSKEENSSDIAQIIRRQADQLNSLVGDLLENAAIDSGDFELNLKSTDLRQCVREVYLLFEKYSANHKLKIEIPDTSVFCQIDNQRINQVIVNLVSNALKFSPAGGEILISLRQTSSFAEVSVQDHGIGVDECDKEKIFEPFRRSKTVQGSIAGSGLGLYTVKRIILAHHGSIEVKSTPGKCTIFICKIPLATSETDERLAKRG